MFRRCRYIDGEAIIHRIYSRTANGESQCGGSLFDLRILVI